LVEQFMSLVVHIREQLGDGVESIVALDVGIGAIHAAHEVDCHSTGALPWIGIALSFPSVDHFLAQIGWVTPRLSGGADLAHFAVYLLQSIGEALVLD
jgi:hypothetical protein